MGNQNAKELIKRLMHANGFVVGEQQDNNICTMLTFLNKNGDQNFYDSLVALYSIPYTRKEVQILFIFPARLVLLLIVY